MKFETDPRPFPRKWQPPRPQEDAQDVHLSPPSPLYLSESPSREPVTSTTTPTRENRGPDLDDREMISRVPSTSGTQRKAKAHSPIVYGGSRENTPRIPVWERMGQRNSVKRRLDLQHAPFDRNRLGPKIWHPNAPKESSGNWSNWKATSAWQPWQPDKIPRCGEFNRSIWLPIQEREWNNTHTPEETSSCHQGGDDDDEEEDETGGIESTESAEQEEERN